MNKFGASLASLLVAVVVAGCGNDQSAAPAQNQSVAQAPVQEAPGNAQPPAQPMAEEPAAQVSGIEQAAAQPESISETEDGGQAPTEPTASTAQPSLRLGGPANTAPTSAQFKEGTNYTRLVPAQPTGVAPGKVEVVEVFWYLYGDRKSVV